LDIRIEKHLTYLEENSTMMNIIGELMRIYMKKTMEMAVYREMSLVATRNTEGSSICLPL